MSRKYVNAALLACACLPLLASSAEQLNVKVGLWEITSVTKLSGMPPLPKEVLDKMTPQQRTRMAEEAKASAAEESAEETNRECLTQKDLERPFQTAMKNCKQSIVATTRTSQEARVVCSGEHPGSGVMRISTPTPQTMSGTLDLKFGEGADAFAIQGQLSGRWLGADCGDEADEADDIDDAVDDDEPADDEEEAIP